MATPEVNGNVGGRWAEKILAPIANDVKIVRWAESVLAEYIDLPRANSQERKKVESLVTKTASILLQDPQCIEIACDVWDDQWFGGSSKDRPGSFYELVKKKSGALIKTNWESIASEQLAEFVRIYAGNTSLDFAQAILTSYFKGPSNRRERIDAYHTFALGLLDLVGDEAAFTAGVKIGLHDTDILPKDPNLIEQTLLLSLPYTIFPNSSNGAKDLLSLPRNKEEERDFQKLLIAKNVMVRLSFLSSEDLGEVRQKYYDFLSTNEKLIKKWEKEQGQAIKQLGRAKVAEINDATVEFDVRKDDDLSEEEKLKLKKIWPFNLFFDETDPLNQKFQEVLSQKGELLERSKK